MRPWRHCSVSPCICPVRSGGSVYCSKAAVSETLPESVLLGTDAPELSVLLGAEASPVQREAQSEVMVVTTRAEASRIKRKKKFSKMRKKPDQVLNQTQF